MPARKPRPDLVDRATVEAMIVEAVAGTRTSASVEAFAPAGYQQQRIEAVAHMLCGLDGVEPGGPTWGATIREATRYVAAFNVLNLHADAVADARRGATTGH